VRFGSRYAEDQVQDLRRLDAIELRPLYAVVCDNVETLYAAVAAGFEGAALPPFVRRELEDARCAGPP